MKNETTFEVHRNSDGWLVSCLQGATVVASAHVASLREIGPACSKLEDQVRSPERNRNIKGETQ